MDMKFTRLLLTCALFLALAATFSAAAQDSEATPEPDAIELGTETDIEPTDEEIEAAAAALGEDGFIGVIACTYETEWHSTVAESAEAYATDLGLRVR